jgi:hypothetical protein
VISVLIVDDHALVRAGLVARLAGEADIAPIGGRAPLDHELIRAVRRICAGENYVVAWPAGTRSPRGRRGRRVEPPRVK